MEIYLDNVIVNVFLLHLMYKAMKSDAFKTRKTFISKKVLYK